jgi:hypothetical protein
LKGLKEAAATERAQLEKMRSEVETSEEASRRATQVSSQCAWLHVRPLVSVPPAQFCCARAIAQAHRDKLTQEEAEEEAQLRDLRDATKSARARLEALHAEAEAAEADRLTETRRQEDAKRTETARLEQIREDSVREEAKLKEARDSLAEAEARNAQVQQETEEVCVLRYVDPLAALLTHLVFRRRFIVKRLGLRDSKGCKSRLILNV